MTTASPAPLGTAAADVRSRVEVLRAEFATWLRKGVRSAAPDGWRVVARLELHPADTDLFLIERDGGGWMTMLREVLCWESCAHGCGVCIDLGWCEATLGGLHRALRTVAEGDPGDRDYRQAVLLLEALTPMLVALYDPTDPVEAAEQTLVALGGRMSVYPRAAD